MNWGNFLVMDDIDRNILAELQQDGRLSITDLAARVGLSVSPCHRRLKELERSGAIEGYRAVLDRSALDLGFEAVVFITMHQGDRSTIAAFEAAIDEVPHVIEAQRLFGDPDYLLRVVSKDLTSFQHLLDDSIASLPGVQRTRSTMVMKHVVRDRPLPA